MEKQYALPLDKYIISSIKAFQDQKKNWHVWVIPVVTVEKFTSNIFYISLKKSRMTIENLDYHDPFYVADSMIDSKGNLFMVEVKPTWEEWIINNQAKWQEEMNQSSPKQTTTDNNEFKQEINLIKVDPWSRQVTKLPIRRDTTSSENEKKKLFLNPSLETTSDGIIIRSMADPDYIYYTIDHISESIERITFFETKILPKTEGKDFMLYDSVSLQPLSARVPVSDIRMALSWDEYKDMETLNYLMIPVESFQLSK